LGQLVQVLRPGRHIHKDGVPATPAVRIEDLREKLAGTDPPPGGRSCGSCITATNHLGDLTLDRHVRFCRVLGLTPGRLSDGHDYTVTSCGIFSCSFALTMSAGTSNTRSVPTI